MASNEDKATTPPAGLLETIQLEHVPSTHTVHIAAFKDVTNAEFLQQQLLSRNAEFEYAFIDASSVTSRLQVLAAVFKAITVQLTGNMKTPNLHSEIVCSLSPNKNISEAYRRFGIAASSQHLIVVKVLIPPSSPSPSPSPPLTPTTISSHLHANIHGTPLIPFTDAVLQSELTDWAKVRKYYKLNGSSCLDAFGDDEVERRRRETEMLVLGGMALRSL